MPDVWLYYIFYVAGFLVVLEYVTPLPQFKPQGMDLGKTLSKARGV